MRLPWEAEPNNDDVIIGLNQRGTNEYRFLINRNQVVYWACDDFDQKLMIALSIVRALKNQGRNFFVNNVHEGSIYMLTDIEATERTYQELEQGQQGFSAFFG
jgi:hypothetical protein